MINLLPPAVKQKLALEHQKNVVIILGLTILIPLICLVLLLLSIKTYISAEVNYQKNTLEQSQKISQDPEFTEFGETIKRGNASLIQLKNFYKKQIYISNALHLISGIDRPENLYFTSLNLHQIEPLAFKVTISGFSQSREDLLVFQKNIQQKKEIENVVFLPESWINPNHTPFYLTFEIEQ